MKLPYENELYELRKWIDFTNANLQMQFLSPHTSGNSARPPMDQCNYERNTSGLSFLCDYVNIPREIAQRDR